MVLKKPDPLGWLKPAVLTGSLVPFAVIAWRGATGRLGANPISTALNQLGLLALVLLCASLACTPLKIVFGWKWPLKVRKMLGLCAFFAALSHFLVYLGLDQLFDFATVIEDVIERPFIAVGFSALVLLVPLAITSTKRMVQRLGPKNWQRLHRLAYVAGALGCVHYLLRVKSDIREPAIYALVLLVLLVVRIFEMIRKRPQQSSGISTNPPV